MTTQRLTPISLNSLPSPSTPQESRADTFFSRAIPRTLIVALSLAASACAIVPTKDTGVVAILNKKAEGALIAGIRAYDEGNYADAERQLKEAVAQKLTVPRDAAAANKYLAFIYCTSDRAKDCANAFREAYRADPSFALENKEVGHPLWGPVYRSVRTEMAK